MLELKITITATEFAEAINNLASALNGNYKMPAPKEAAPVASAPAAQPATPTATVNPTPAPAAPMTTPAYMPNAATAPPVVPAANTAPAPVPTAAPQYTLDMIATAGSALIDAGKIDQLMQLLTKYGVSSLTNLKPENYGAIANDLRTLGARI